MGPRCTEHMMNVTGLWDTALSPSLHHCCPNKLPPVLSTLDTEFPPAKRVLLVCFWCSEIKHLHFHQGFFPIQSELCVPKSPDTDVREHPRSCQMGRTASLS